MLTVIAALVGIVVGSLATWGWLRTASASRLRLAEDKRRAIIGDAEREVEATRREAQIESREQAVRLRAEIEAEVQHRRLQIAKVEERAAQREVELDAKLTELARREQGIADREAHLKSLQEEVKSAKDEILKELQRIGNLTLGEARQQLLERSEDLVRHELARSVRQMEEEARADAKRRARALVADALQRVAASHTAETTVSVVELASDDMKGRIIGREGRNIRALEHLTGVDFIIDDTPHAVVLSSFDGLRREVARMTLEKLIEDGRIHPARIEEMYYQSKAELEEHVLQAGQQAVFEANCGTFHEELVKVLGRLRYRTSYGQNVLKHTLEVVHLAGVMASELGASVKTAKRAAVLHDVGKAMTHEVEGSHAAVSAQLARRFGESDGVIHAIEAHHYEVQPQTVEAVLLISADAISASRPGARGESLEHYIKRLSALEEIASAKPGVAKAYALQAGREIRVIVEPAEVDDEGAVLLSHEIAREIEDQLEYPGQVKVIVIRESRAVEVAK
ncbi:ribonuclease Y [Gaiella occulta]|uniref:Ribonuclease Y n=1 Tax=Gaiella occulta TaxID=1002870 RepID=A0A7M2Z050_9ACTN|nr:ribonuclease Y [Gaiella occulta]RDI75132.1 ribonuclease Y [Gaiella occulta]